MNPLISTILICEENKTRAELYEMWLDSYDVQIAVTEQQANEKITAETAVAIINDEFCNGAASTIIETIRSKAVVCRVIAMRERNTDCQHLTVDHELVKPIFQNELSEQVDTLMRRSNYHFAIKLYYRTTTQLTTLEQNAEGQTPDTERYERLKHQAERLKPIIVRRRDQLSQDDIIAIQQVVSSNAAVDDTDSTEKLDNKRRPESCSHCEERWTRSADGTLGVTRIGAYVWLCDNCGHVQRGADPSHQNVY